MATSNKASKTSSKTPSKPSSPGVVVSTAKASKPKDANAFSGWLQDVSIEVPVPADADFMPGQRELEFSVGLRQQNVDGFVRSELRARALIHTQGSILALVEASFVNVEPESSQSRPDLAQQLYSQLRPNLEKMLAFAGHTPPLPQSLDKIA